MKNIIFPVTNRVHLARQKFLIQELKKYFNVDVWEAKEEKGSMDVNAIFYAIQFNNYMKGKKFDLALIRGDRYEVLPIATSCLYRGIPIVHIEGGDESGVVDNKVRHAITHLSDYHFCTNKESLQKLVNMGVPVENVWNFGSLDVEFANKVKPKRLRSGLYILVAYHPIKGENEKKLDKALENFKEDAPIRIGSNKDSGRAYGSEEFSPEDYINLLRYAKCAVGNSSSLLKEASILGTPVVLIGDRQKKRLMPHNVVNVSCKTERITKAIIYQMQNKYKKDLIYYQPNTSKKICQQLLKELN